MERAPLKYSQDGVVSFEDATHTYKVVATGEILLSGTSLVKLFKSPFDPDGSICQRVADREGNTFAEQKEIWRANGQATAEYGTEVHAELEYFNNTNEIRFSDHSDIVAYYATLPRIGKCYPEAIVYDLENGIAGQVDEPFIHRGVVHIGDFKTYKKMEFFSPWGNRMTNGLSHLHDVNHIHTTLQLSLYGYLFELRGLKVGNLTLKHINPKTRKIDIYPCRYLKDEVKHMLYMNKQFKEQENGEQKKE